MQKEKKKYPIGAEFYTVFEEVGTGVSASVYRALCIPLNEVVAIKILDFERNNCNLDNVSREAQTMVLVDHPNVLKSHCSFVDGHTLWVVTPYMSGGSCLHILKSRHPDGLEEVVIATILREVLKGLEYIHQHGHIHRDVKAGNILIDSRGGITLGDFGVSAYMFDAGDRQRSRNTLTGTPCWMAPEVMEQLHGYDFKADIWSFGITALELAHGHAPFSKYPPLKVLLMTLQNAPPGLDYERDKKFSKSFKQMIASCLVKDPLKRPSAKKLLKHSFFKQARSNDYILRTLLEGLPALGDRFQELKRKDEDMLAQKKMPDGEKEEISQNEYKRGISGWDFNIEDMKAQASLIPDDDVILEKDEDMQTKQLQANPSMSRYPKVLQHQSSFASQYSDAADLDDNCPVSLSSVDSISNTAKCEKFANDVSTLEQPMTMINLAHGNNNQAVNSPAEKLASYADRKSSNGASSIPNQTDKVQNTSQNSLQGRATILQLSDSQEIIPKGSKTSVNGEEVDEKAKIPVVQQKGRFKVTSESVEMEKVNIQVVPSPILQKSHSLQVISQLPTMSTHSPNDATQSNPSGAIFSLLQNLLLTNTLQRDGILSAMKQLAIGDFSEMGCTPMTVTDKSLLEAAHEREKELIREIADLNLRLVRTREEIKQELQKHK